MKKTKKKDVKTPELIPNDTEKEITELADVLNSWSPIIFVQTPDQDTLFTDMTSAVKKINRDSDNDSRTKLLWFNISSGLHEVYIYSEDEMKRDETSKVKAPNGYKLEPITAQSGAVSGREVMYNLENLLKEYSAFSPNQAASHPFHSTCLMICDVNRELENNTVVKHSLTHFLRQTEVFFTREIVNRQIIIVSNAPKIPMELERSNVVYHHGGYTHSKIMESLVPDPKDSTPKENLIASKVAKAMGGLTLCEAQSALNLMANLKPDENRDNFALEELTDKDINFLTHKRKDIINKGNLLSIVQPDSTLDDIGGNELLKEFIVELDRSYNHPIEARDFGIDAHRGILFLGPPGTGKSTLCNGIARFLQCPYMRLDLSKIMESRVGSSESNIDTALAMAEKIGGVLQIDEIEKKLGGVESSNKVDGGIMLRIFDKILEYMTRDNDILFIATANDIEGLPPELTRKGRIDEIFLIDYPCEDEIVQILDIHVSKSGRKLTEFLSEKEETKLIKSLDKWTGSEIKYVVSKALRKAFISENKKLTYKLFNDIINETVPMSKTYSSKLNKVREWAVTVANPTSNGSDFAKMKKESMQKDT